MRDNKHNALNRDHIILPDTDVRNEEFITHGDNHEFVRSLPIPPHPATKFDEHEFLLLLSKSPNLAAREKAAIVKNICRLDQGRIDALFEILHDENRHK